MRTLLYGAGGHGRVVADIVASLSRLELAGFIDDDSALHGRVLGGAPVLGSSAALPGLLSEGVRGAIVTVGRNVVRMRLAGEMEQLGFELVAAVHPSAVLAPEVTVGRGTVVMAGVVVNTGSTVGDNVILNTGATIDHDCQVEDGSHVSPGVHLAGGVHLERGVHVGIGANIIESISIGPGATIGAGAVVLRDVGPGETWVGNPARLNKSGGGSDS